MSVEQPNGNNEAGMMTDCSAVIPEHTFDCQLCLAMLCEPVTIACGHTFCKTCLIAALERSRKRCPTCRTPCHFSAKGRVVNVLLQSILKQYFPTQYQQRLTEIQDIERSFKTQIPLFCFNEVLFPHQPFHLHFFEPRYRLMIHRALETNRQFGFCASYEPQAGMYGTIAEIKECEFLADGRSLVQCEGRQRFKILETWVEDSTEGLWYAKVDFFEEDAPASDEESAQIVELAASAETKLHTFLSTMSSEKRSQLTVALGTVPSKDDAYKLSLWLSSLLPATLRGKNMLLATTSTKTRLKYVVQGLNMLLGMSATSRSSGVSSSGESSDVNMTTQDSVNDDADSGVSGS